MHICRTLDSDGSGFLDLKEFLLAIELVAAQTPEDKLLWAFRQYDTDNSGCVDRGAFKKYMDFSRLQGFFKYQIKLVAPNFLPIFVFADVSQNEAIFQNNF